MVIAKEPRGEVDVVTDFTESIEIDRTFSLLHGSTLEKEPYLIKDAHIDYPNGLVHITAEDDGSLYDMPHNKIELRGDDYIFKIISCTPDYDTNTTTLEVIDKNGNIRDIINKDITNYRAEWGIFSGRFVFDIVEVTTDLNNTIVRIEPNENICNITSTFTAKWATDFDFDWAERYDNSKSYHWNNFDNVTFDDASNQSWGMMEYHNTPITGFKITEIKSIGWIKFNDVKWSYQIPITVESNSRWAYFTELLNSSDEEYVRDFDYYLIDNYYVQAIPKVLGINSLITLQPSGNVKCQLETYPKANFEVWQQMYYSGYNNPAMWHYLKQGELDDDKFWPLVGSFNLTDTFISYKDMVLPKFTTVFIVFSTPDDISFNSTYKWELWEEKTDKLLVKSNYRYLIWNFVDESIYTVRLTFMDDNENERSFIKKSWIYIK